MSRRVFLEETVFELGPGRVVRFDYTEMEMNNRTFMYSFNTGKHVREGRGQEQRSRGRMF